MRHKDDRDKDSATSVCVQENDFYAGLPFRILFLSPHPQTLFLEYLGGGGQPPPLPGNTRESSRHSLVVVGISAAGNYFQTRHRGFAPK